MKKRISYLVALGLLAGAVADARSWSLEDCNDVGPAAEKRAAYAAAVEAAAPDTPLYAPHPFPSTDAQVFADFLAFHASAFGDTPLDSMPPSEQRLFTALAEQRIRYEVVEVENWSPLRCAVPNSRRRWSVLRLYDMADGTELARATVDDVGHVGRLRHRPLDRELDPMVDLPAARSAIRGFASDARDAQLVGAWGTVGCDELDPCVAMRGSDSVYLLSRRSGELFRFDLDSPRLSFRSDLAAGRRAATLTQAAERGVRLISLGGDSLTEVQPVGGDRTKP